jgi:hypothetical protein
MRICPTCSERVDAERQRNAEMAEARTRALDTFPQRFVAAMRAAGSPGLTAFYSRRPRLLDVPTLQGWEIVHQWGEEMGPHFSHYAMTVDGNLYAIHPSGHRKAWYADGSACSSAIVFSLFEEIAGAGRRLGVDVPISDLNR